MSEDASNLSFDKDKTTLYDFISESYKFYTNKKINNYLQIFVYEPKSHEVIDNLQSFHDKTKNLIIFVGDVKRMHLCLCQYDANIHKINLRDDEITNKLYSQQRWEALHQYLWMDEHGEIER